MTPQRIASLLASATEILYCVGAGQRVVAVSHECDWPADAAHKPRVTRTKIDASAPSAAIDEQVRELLAAGEPLYEIDVEKLVALAPELIVTQSQCDVCAVRLADVEACVASYPALQGARIVDLNPYRLSEIFIDIERVGTAAGCAAAARELVDDLERRVDLVRSRGNSLATAQRRKVACLEWIDPLMVAGNWMPELVELAGGQYPLATGGKHSGYSRWSDVRDFAPEVLVVMPCGFDLAKTLADSATLQALPGWSELPAVRQGRAWAVDGNAYFNRSGPRMVDSLELLAHLIDADLHPLPATLSGLNGIWAPLS